MSYSALILHPSSLKQSSLKLCDQVLHGCEHHPERLVRLELHWSHHAELNARSLEFIPEYQHVVEAATQAIKADDNDHIDRPAPDGLTKPGQPCPAERQTARVAIDQFQLHIRVLG